MSVFFLFLDIGRVQCPKICKIQTLSPINVWKSPKNGHWTGSMSGNSPKTDIGRDQCPEIHQKRTLDAINVRKFTKNRHWTRSMSGKWEKTDIGRSQCPENLKSKTLIAANVQNGVISGVEARPCARKDM